MSGDQVYFWTNALRMLDGQRIYLDFFQFTPPGTNLVYLALFEIFGPRIWVTNIAVLLLGAGFAWVCFSISIWLMSRSSALLASALFLVLIYGRLLNGTHHLFSMLLILCAVRVFMAGNGLNRTAAAGALLGLSAFFTHSHGLAVLAAFSVFLLWSRFCNTSSQRAFWPSWMLLVACFVVVLVLVFTPFVMTSGAERIWHSQVTYVREYMVGQHLPWLGLPEPPTLRRFYTVGQYLSVYLMLPVVYLLVFMHYARRRGAGVPERQRLVLLALVGSTLLAEVAFTPNWLRMYAVSAPGVILLAWVAAASQWKRYAVPLLWIMVVCITLQQTWARVRRDYEVIDLPAGRAAVLPQAQEKLQWLAQHIAPGDFFFQAGWPGLYLPLRLRNPAFLDVVETTGVTPPEYVTRAVQELEAKNIRL
ncbi:MAG: hypothetical protein AB7O65_02435, partial [Candidatus Korobacteraceae bacterium]